MDGWRVEINPDHRTEGFCFHLVGCPIAKHAKAHGYGELLPYLCRTDHYLAALMHARLIRTQTEALGGSCCGYWYVGDRSPVLEKYKGLEQIWGGSDLFRDSQGFGIQGGKCIQFSSAFDAFI